MENRFTSEFGPYDGDGDSIQTEADANGVFYRARIQRDDFMPEPWKDSDCYGFVSEWRPIDSKRPGERVMYQDGRSALFYDVEATTIKAREEGWDAEPYSDTETPGQRAAKAVEADFKRLRAWCRDEWYYVSVILSQHQEMDGDEIELNDYLECLGGIESDAGSYLTEVANELLAEAGHNSKSKRMVVTTEGIDR